MRHLIQLSSSRGYLGRHKDGPESYSLSEAEVTDCCIFLQVKVLHVLMDPYPLHRANYSSPC